MKRDCHVRTAVVRSRLDIDSILLDIDLGFGVHAEVPCGFNAVMFDPPGSPSYIEAQKYLDKLLPIGTGVIIQSFRELKPLRFKYVVKIFCPPQAVSVNDMLLAVKFAKPYSSIGRK